MVKHANLRWASLGHRLVGHRHRPSYWPFFAVSSGSGNIVYVGISLLLQWKIKYGGCEVVSLPTILFKRRYVTYCIPLVAVDATEKELVTARLNWQKVLWGGVLASLLGALLALILTELL